MKKNQSTQSKAIETLVGLGCSTFPIYDYTMRYTFSELSDPMVQATLKAPGRTILAVDADEQVVIIGCKASTNTAVRSVINGRMVSVPA